MNKSALFSDNRTYRYALFRTWDEDLPVALCIGLNPSTADVIFCWGKFKVAQWRIRQVEPMFPGALLFWQDSRRQAVPSPSRSGVAEIKAKLQPYEQSIRI